MDRRRFDAIHEGYEGAVTEATHHAELIDAARTAAPMWKSLYGA